MKQVREIHNENRTRNSRGDILPREYKLNYVKKYVLLQVRFKTGLKREFLYKMSRFLRNKRDIFLSLQRDNETIMNVTKEIRRRIAGFSEDYVFTASDFEIKTQNQSAVVKALNRMVKSGEITKLANYQKKIYLAIFLKFQQNLKI